MCGGGGGGGDGPFDVEMKFDIIGGPRCIGLERDVPGVPGDRCEYLLGLFDEGRNEEKRGLVCPPIAPGPVVELFFDTPVDIVPFPRR